METLAQIYSRYSAPDCHTGSDKGTLHSYIEIYEKLLAPYRGTAQAVLEIGIMGGQSLRMFEEYFTGTKVYGIDISDQPVGGMVDLRPMIAEGGHRITIMDAEQKAQVEHHFSNTIFDVIVEDAQHLVSQQIAMYANFRPHLARNGIYVIEDIADIDRDGPIIAKAINELNPDVCFRIFDRRSVKGRFDDVLIVIGGKDL